MAGAQIVLLAACLLLLEASAAALDHLDLSPSYGRTVIDNEGGVVVVWDHYPDTAFLNLAAWYVGLNEGGIQFPGHQDVDSLAYVYEGSAKFGLVLSNGRSVATTTIKAGDAVLIPKEAVFWFYNDGKGIFKIAGIGDTTSGLKQGQILRIDVAGAGGILHGFTKDVLAAAWDVDTATATTFIRAQHSISLGLAKGPLSLSPPDSALTYDGEFVFPLLSRPADVSIVNGGSLWNVVTTRGSYKPLESVHLGAEFVQQLPGSLFGPAWAPNAHMLYYFTKGSARVQLVRPVDSRLSLDTEVHAGQVIPIPKQFGFVIVAGAEGVEYFTVADNDKPTGSFVAGKLSQYKGIPKEIVAESFNVDESLVRQVIGQRPNSYIILPPHDNPAAQASIASVV